MLNAQWGQTNQNKGFWRREWFFAEPNKENGWIMFKYPKLPDGFERKVFIGKIWGEGSRILWLFSDRLAVSKRVVFQTSCAQPEVTIVHVGRGFSSYRIVQRYCYVYSLRRNQDPASRLCFFFSWLILLYFYIPSISLICCWWCSVANLCPPLCNPMDCSTPGFSVFYHLLELAKTHVHWVGDAIQPSHPLLSPSPPAFSLSQQRAWICSLEIREGQGCWMKLLSYKQVEVEGRKAFMPRRAWWGPVQFHKHTEEHTQKRSYSFQLKIIAMRWQCKTH